jgi:hypothetical protein
MRMKHLKNLIKEDFYDEWWSLSEKTIKKNSIIGVNDTKHIKQKEVNNE